MLMLGVKWGSKISTSLLKHLNVVCKYLKILHSSPQSHLRIRNERTLSVGTWSWRNVGRRCLSCRGKSRSDWQRWRKRSKKGRRENEWSMRDADSRSWTNNLRDRESRSDRGRRRDARRSREERCVQKFSACFAPSTAFVTL